MDITRVTLLGHKDHGKSTLIGNLLIQTKSASEAKISEAKRISKSLGRQFEPGFILDSFEEEREGGLTIDTTRAQILYKGKAFEFIDVPGHEELIKNMISGASNADFAVLMVSAKEDEGIRPQTFRHLYLAGMLGIKRIVVAVNKMDSVKYSEGRFDEIRGQVDGFLLRIGFSKDAINFIPLSAYTAENLITRSPKMPWYGGDTLLDTMLEDAKAIHANSDELRISVQGNLEQGKDSLLIGKILSGSIKNGERVISLPKGERFAVKGIFMKGKKTSSASIGQNVALKLDKPAGKELRGSVITAESSALRPSKRISALIFAVKKPTGMATLRINGNSLQCSVKVNEVIDTTTGKPSKGALGPLNAARATIELRDSIVVEPFSKSEELGRFVLYDGNEFSGIGTVL